MKSTIGTMAAILAVATVAGAQEKKSWTDTIALKGDFRYRIESIDEEGKDQRDRHRIRLRVGASAEVNDEVKTFLRLATGDGDPVSTNQTLGDGFSKKDIHLDLAYAEWKPAVTPGLVLLGGKVENPFIAVADLVWDSDLTPEGVAATYKAGEGGQVMAGAGYFWVEERSSGDDTMLYGGQVAAKVGVGKGATLLAGASYYLYDQVKGQELFVDPEKSFGNTTETIDVGTAEEPEEMLVYAEDFAEVEGFVQLDFDLGVPVAVYGQYVVNQDASAYDTGYLGGFTVGKAKDPGSFEFGYNYRELEANAVLGAFADSDSSGGGTDGRGHKVMAKYQFFKSWQCAATYYMDEKGISKTAKDYNRLQVDLMAKF
jgi:hypothetical protein